MVKFNSIADVDPHPAYWVNVHKEKQRGRDIYQMWHWGLGCSSENEFEEVVSFILDNYTPKNEELAMHPAEDMTPDGVWSKLSKEEQDRIAQNMYEMYEDY